MKKIVILIALLLIVSCTTKIEDETIPKVEETSAELNLTLNVENTTEKSLQEDKTETKSEETKTEIKTETPSLQEIEAKIISVSETTSPFMNFGVKIYFPKPNLVLKGPILSLSLIPDNFTISQPDKVNKWGQGHFKVWFDYSNETYIMEDAAKTFRHLPAGKRTVFIELMQNNGSGYGIVNSVDFEVPNTGIAERGSELFR